MGEVAGASFLLFLRLRLDQGRESLIGIEVGRAQAMSFFASIYSLCVYE